MMKIEIEIDETDIIALALQKIAEKGVDLGNLLGSSKDHRDFRGDICISMYCSSSGCTAILGEPGSGTLTATFVVKDSVGEKKNS